MRISTKGRYGLTIMIELARNYGEGPLPLKAIAQANDLSENYLEQIVSPLRNAGLVKSVRGAHGGYILSRDPDKITAGDIIRTLEGPIRLVEGIEEEEPAKRELWIRIRDAIRNVLDQTTLKDLADYSDEESNETGYMFYI
ncbi:cysteine metabolism transcriptional regulator CymR [Fervidibacillus halotolerans]|uniref:Rrf2 family transcriptional regulator n=1 Tax=Fervidibacillus halotolerans TaxID=2980027 RepID=A0A9E8RXB4_9BACI|nr:Rrf2 family transcriptional regulator [Fervidibacillus halotolerans]WAA11551.1 Rrf2 family transcriptional regulator [Fervidibacillus halotolerans]